MYNWADYVDPDNIEKFKKDFKVDDVHLRHLRVERGAAHQAPGRGDGPVGHRRADRRVRRGHGRGQASSRSSTGRRSRTLPYIDPQFQNFYHGDKADLNNYHLPKDWGTTGIAIRTKDVKEDVRTWKDFFDVAPKYSGRIVVVNSPGDVFVAPLKALGYSRQLGRSRRARQGAATCSCGLAPHVLALDSDTYEDKLADEEAVMGLAWTGGIDDLQEKPETADTKYIIPEDGTLYWMDTWVIFKDPPHPNAAYAFLNFIQDPAIQAKETSRTATPRPTSRRRSSCRRRS